MQFPRKAMGVALSAGLLLFIVNAVWAEPEVFRALKHDMSAPLKTLSPLPGYSGVKEMASDDEALPDPSERDATVGASPDPVAQKSFGAAAAPTLIQNFDGISTHGDIPPDTNGEVGRNFYVQMVNTKFSVFSKTGNQVYGPVDIQTLWQGFGGICENHNQGDPIVVYDQLADRWLLSQFAYIDPNTHFECVAISATGDPTGSYYRYAFDFPYFNDYPKWGVWPDAYYSTYILRRFDWSVVSERICAFERSEMLSGDSPRVICFDKGHLGLLPADLDGITPPPAGSPHFSLDLTSTQLGLWKFHVDWTTPSASTFTGPTNLNVASYSVACGSTRVCIPQPGVSQKLDAFSDRLMFRLSYRNLGSYESLVVNHSVDAGGGISGVRWYEVRSPNSRPVLYQQGTYAPDNNHRWMGSIATDLNGNMGLGFNISGNSVHPGIRCTGRLVNDPKGKMPQGEKIIWDPNASQNGSNRWGDYSDLTVDPVDDCTFWYTTEYAGGNLNWRTRIASFKFPSCGCAVPAGIANTSAVDVDPNAHTGVLISWEADAGNWGDNTNGIRSYDVLREKVVLASSLPYGTTSYLDTTGTAGQSYKYKVRYTNGCGKKGTAKKAIAADN